MHRSLSYQAVVKASALIYPLLQPVEKSLHNAVRQEHRPTDCTDLGVYWFRAPAWFSPAK
jgi:hypothetical protein